MNIGRRLLGSLLLAFIIVNVFSVPVAQAAAQSTNGQTATNTTFTPELDLPGVFSGPQTSDSSLLAKYLRAIFIYFIWVVGIIAGAMIVYAGVKWISAAGNPGRIKDARETLNSAIIGVIIALTSVLLLSIIDPRLTKFASLTPGRIATMNLNLDCVERTCPNGYTQVIGGRCANIVAIGAAEYAQPGEPNCTGGVARSICCQSTSNNQRCLALEGTSLSQVPGRCDLTAYVMPKVYCSDTTACGKLKSDLSCKGVYCDAGKICVPHSDQSNGEYAGTCVPADGHYTYSYSGCPNVGLDLSSSTPCGQRQPQITETGSIMVDGTAPCSNQRRCIITPPNVTQPDPSVPANQCTWSPAVTSCVP